MVIIMECQALISFKHSRANNKAAYANHVLILNLAVADFMMGVYLFGVGTVDVMLSGVYCMRSSEWLHGLTCKALGVIVGVATQASVLTLVLLTAFRVVTLRDVSLAL